MEVGDLSEIVLAQKILNLQSWVREPIWKAKLVIVDLLIFYRRVTMAKNMESSLEEVPEVEVHLKEEMSVTKVLPKRKSSSRKSVEKGSESVSKKRRLPKLTYVNLEDEEMEESVEDTLSDPLEAKKEERKSVFKMMSKMDVHQLVAMGWSAMSDFNKDRIVVEHLKRY